MPGFLLGMKQGTSTEPKRKTVKEFTEALGSTREVNPDLVAVLIERTSAGKYRQVRQAPL